MLLSFCFCLHSSLGLLSSAPVNLVGTPLRALAAHLERSLELGKQRERDRGRAFYASNLTFLLGPHEYDTVLLQHVIGIENSNSTKVAKN